MRQRHPAGERLFVDYAGHTVDVVCPKTGEVRTAQIFVTTLEASSYTYVEASWTQSLPDWISSHVRAFEFFGGVPAQLVPDNLKAGVIDLRWITASFRKPHSHILNRGALPSPNLRRIHAVFF
jgi:transposase